MRLLRLITVAKNLYFLSYLMAYPPLRGLVVQEFHREKPFFMKRRDHSPMKIGVSWFLRVPQLEKLLREYQ